MSGLPTFLLRGNVVDLAVAVVYFFVVVPVNTLMRRRRLLSVNRSRYFRQSEA